MADAFSKSMVIQILISIPLIILGMAAMYLIHRANSEPAQIAAYDLSDEPDKDNEPHAEEKPTHKYSPKLTPRKPKERDLIKPSADLAKRLEKFKYDGYMQVGKAKIAWLSDGISRISVEEGGTLDDSIKVDKIHENFLLVSVDDHTSHKIPFTPGSDERNLATRSTGSIQNTSQNRPSGKDRSRYAPPSIPGDISPPATRRSRRYDAETVIHIDPELKTVTSVGETFTVQVKINNGSDVFAVPFDIGYDPDILEVIGLHEGSYLKKDGGQTTFLTSIDKNKGKIRLGLTRLGKLGGINGSGTLASIAFKVLKNRPTSLSLVNGKPMDSKLNVLPAKFVRGQIKVQ